LIRSRSIGSFSLDELFIKELVVFGRKGKSHSWSSLGEVAVLGVFAADTNIVSVTCLESIIKSGDLVLGHGEFKNGENLA